MNIAKNMEIIFVAAIALVSMTGLASAAVQAQAHKSASPEVVKVGEVPTMTVITVTGKRLSAAEKAQLGN